MLCNAGYGMTRARALSLSRTMQAFARAGATKKQQLMQAMIKRIGDAPGASGSTSISPASSKPAEPSAASVPEVVKKKYSMDYSRFDQLADDSDDEDDVPPRSFTAAANPSRGPPRDLHTRMPPRFLEAMPRKR